MAGKITALVVQKKDKERVNIFIDDHFAFGASLNLALALKKGQFLTDQAIAELKAHDEIEKAYQNTLAYLSYRARTRQEIEQYLQKKEAPEDVIAQVVDRLIRQGYLNDAEFGRMWVENRTQLNPKGKQALRYELRQKGIGSGEIEEALTDLNEDDLAWQAVAKQLKRWQSLDEFSFRKKITGYLARRGFNYETIDAVFVKAWAENKQNLELKSDL